MNAQLELEKWRQQLDENIRQENSWLALAGLFWLKEGVNGCGSAEACPISLPSSYPAHVADFVLADGVVRLCPTAASHPPLMVDNQPAGGEITLLPDISGTPTRIQLGELSMVIIQRGTEYGVRLWDNGRTERHTHPPRTWFPYDPAYTVLATYHTYPSPTHFTIVNSVGMELQMLAQGYVTFAIRGKSCRLEAPQEPMGELYLSFKDGTNGQETYLAGRYLLTPPPEGGIVTLDFNRAYNPPCVFTHFATCPFPPRANYLPVSILAGERV
jgi:uncharacterized protein